MKYLLLIIFFSPFALPAQQFKKDLSLEEIIKSKNPSVHALNEIKMINKFDSTFNYAIQNYVEKNGSTVGFEFDFSPYLSYLRRLILSEDETIIRQYAALQIPKIAISGCKLELRDSTFKRICLQILKPDDAIWRVNVDYSILFFSNLYTNDALKKYLIEKSSSYSKLDPTEQIEYKRIMYKNSLEYQNEIFEKNPDKIVRLHALVSILDLLHLLNKYDEAVHYYTILKKDYFDSEYGKRALINFNPSAKLKVGGSIPSFNFSLIGSDKKVSSTSLLGKFYLIQLWATWCGPCLSEMPMIRSAYDKYKKLNFTILSLSLDHSIDILKQYWRKDGAMPWDNVFMEKGFEDQFFKELGITGIPVLILVGIDGRILETHFDSEKALTDTMSRYVMGTIE